MDVLGFISTFLIGIAILVTIFPQETFRGPFFVLTVCLGTGMGLGITSSLIFFWLTAFGQPTFYYFLFEFIVALLLAILACYRVITKKKAGVYPMIVSITGYNVIGWLKLVFYLLLGISVASFAIKTFGVDPHGIHDARAIWNFRARWLFHSGIQWDYIFSPEMTSSHPDYPLLLPLSIFRIWKLISGDIVAVPILIAGFFTFGSILLIYSSVAILRGQNQGSMAAIFMFLTTQFLNLGTYQYADIPLAFYFLSTIILLCLRDRYTPASAHIMFLAGLTVSCAAWTKNEGLLFLVLVVSVLILSDLFKPDLRRSIRDLVSFFIGLMPILCTVVLFKLKFAPPNDVVNLESLPYIWSCLFQLERYRQVFSEFAASIVFYNDGVVILMLLYLASSGFDKTVLNYRRCFAPIAILSLLLLGYFFSYIVSPHDLEWHLSTSLRRLIIHILPSIVFIFFYIVKGPEADQDFVME